MLEPQVPVQAAGAVFLDDEARRALLLAAPFRRRLGGLRRSPACARTRRARPLCPFAFSLRLRHRIDSCALPVSASRSSASSPWSGVAQALAAKPASEPFFPRAGNQGYDALHYEVRLTYKPKGGRIKASTEIEAVATQSLRGFTLDFFGPEVEEVKIGGEPVRFRRRPGKLIVSSPVAIAKSERFTALVRYSGLPPKITDPDGSQEGWFRTDDGVIAVGEPQGTAAWIPCNNVPNDKATFGFQITLPDGLKAVANGRRRRSVNRGAGVQMNWVERAPMSTYLAVLNIGRGRIVKSRAGGLPTWTLIDPRLERASLGPLAALPEVDPLRGRRLRRYPFDSAGSLVDYAPSLGYALETQSRPIYAYVARRDARSSTRSPTSGSATRSG